MNSFCSKVCTTDNALLLLRVAVGLIFTIHGYGKLFGAPGMVGFTGMVAKIGFPLPVVFAYIAALSEFVGGIAILLGLFTCLFTALVSVNMLVVLIFLKKFQFPMSDVEFSLLCMSLAINMMGPGKYSLAAMMGRGRHIHGDDCCKETK